MKFTSKCILFAVTLAYYGSTAVSAAPVTVGEYSVAARSTEYEDINAREIDDMELFVRDPARMAALNTGIVSSNNGRRDELKRKMDRKRHKIFQDLAASNNMNAE